MSDAAVVVVGGTSGIGLRLAETYAARGRKVVVTSRDLARAEATAASIDGSVTACAVDLASPQDIAGCLRDIGGVDRLVLGAVDRDENTVTDYDLVSATRLVTV